MNWRSIPKDRGFRGAGAGLLVVVVAFASLTCFVGGPRGAAAMVQGHLVYVSPPIPPDGPCRAMQPLRVPITVTNLWRGEVLIHDRSTRCGRAIVEGLPARLHPFQSQQFAFVADPRDIGLQQFTARLSAHYGGTTETIPLSLALVVHADQIDRPVFAGYWRGGGANVSRTVRLESLPAANLRAIEGISVAGWSVRAASAQKDRSLDIQISGKTPAQNEGEFILQFRALFDSKELRCANVRIAAILVPEWEVPRAVAIDPLSCPAGETVVVIVHRPRDESRDRSWIELAGESTERVDVLL